MPELHRCHRGARCANREVDPHQTAVKKGARINPSEGLCDACERVVRRAIAALPQDYVELDIELAGSRDALRQNVAGTRDLPVPVSLAIATAQEEILHELQCWAESTAEILRVTWDTQEARDSRPGPVLQRAARLLCGALSPFLALRGVLHVGWSGDEWADVERDGLDGAETLVELHYRARSLTGQRRYVERLPCPCPRCERVALGRDDGKETIVCAACGHAFTWDEYQELCGLLAPRKQLAS